MQRGERRPFLTSMPVPRALFCLSRAFLRSFASHAPFSGRQHPSIAAAVVLVTWLTLNIGLNFFNKEVFSERVGFTFPIFFTMFHMVSRMPHASIAPRWAQCTLTPLPATEADALRASFPPSQPPSEPARASDAPPRRLLRRLHPSLAEPS